MKRYEDTQRFMKQTSYIIFRACGMEGSVRLAFLPICRRKRDGVNPINFVNPFCAVLRYNMMKTKKLAENQFPIRDKTWVERIRRPIPLACL